MYQVCYVLGSFDPVERAIAIGKVLKALCRIDQDWLAHHPEAPRLEDAGIRLIPEPKDIDAWHDIPTLLRTKQATLPEFRCALAAERAQGGKPMIPTLDTVDDEQTRFTVSTDLFDGEHERALSHRALSHLLVGLTEIDAMLLRRHPEYPGIYDGYVRYEEEPLGQEDWQDAPTSVTLGTADCEDLACWRAAELNVRYGVRARPSFVWRKRPSGAYLYHIQVTHPNGAVEDPSRRLGME